MHSVYIPILKKITRDFRFETRKKYDQYSSEILKCYTETSAQSDYLDDLTLLAAGWQFSIFSNNTYRIEKYEKLINLLIKEHGKEYFNEDMNQKLDDLYKTSKGADSGKSYIQLGSRQFITDILKLYPFSSKAAGYNTDITFLKSIKTGYPLNKNFRVLFPLYFCLLSKQFDFPDNDTMALVNIRNLLLFTEDDWEINRLINEEIISIFSTYFIMDCSERRYLYTDMDFIYDQLEENSPEDLLPCCEKDQIKSDLQKNRESLEILLATQNVINSSSESEIRLALFERVFYNRRRSFENKKETALELFLRTKETFKTVPVNTKKPGEIYYPKQEFKNTLNSEASVAACMYMLIKEMSFDELKKVFHINEEKKESFSQAENWKPYCETLGFSLTETEKQSFSEKDNTLLEQMMAFLYMETMAYTGKQKDSKNKFDFLSLMTPYFSKIFIEDAASVFTQDFFWWTRMETALHTASRSQNFCDNLTDRANEILDSNYLNLPQDFKSTRYESLYRLTSTAFIDNLTDLSSIQNPSLLITALYRLSRIEPDYKESCIALLNLLREIQKEYIPVFFDKNTKKWNADAEKNQKILHEIDSGFLINNIYQHFYPFSSMDAIKHYEGELYLRRPKIHITIFPETDYQFLISETNKIILDHRATNKFQMHSRSLYYDRCMDVHSGENRTVVHLLKPQNWKDLLNTIEDAFFRIFTDISDNTDLWSNTEPIIFNNEKEPQEAFLSLIDLITNLLFQHFDSITEEDLNIISLGNVYQEANEFFEKNNSEILKKTEENGVKDFSEKELDDLKNKLRTQVFTGFFCSAVEKLKKKVQDAKPEYDEVFTETLRNFLNILFLTYTAEEDIINGEDFIIENQGAVSLYLILISLRFSHKFFK